MKKYQYEIEFYASKPQLQIHNLLRLFLKTANPKIYIDINVECNEVEFNINEGHCYKTTFASYRPIDTELIDRVVTIIKYYDIFVSDPCRVDGKL